MLDAASLVQPALLSGPGFTVDSHVEIRGYMARFTLDTSIGPLTAASVQILAEREAELPALDALDKATSSHAFLIATGDRFVSSAKALGHVFLHPIDTLLGIPSGVARYFGTRLDKLGTQAQTLSDRAARRGTEGNPYPVAAGPMTDARHDGDPVAKHSHAKTWYGRIGSESDREIKRQLKYNQIKREIAKQLGLDPYTSNPYVSERLDRIAWAGVTGNYLAGAALGTVGGTGATVLAKSAQVDQAVWALDPADLREKNFERLGAYCADRLLIRQFLRRGAFTPTLQTALIDALDRLKPAGGCDALLELGMTADTELEARFVVNALDMLLAQLGKRAPGGSLRTVGAGLAYQTRDGELVLPLPVDYLVWTRQVGTFFDRAEFRVAHKTALIGGHATLRTQRELTNRGWSLVLRAPWPGSPPYADDGNPAPVAEPD